MEEVSVNRKVQFIVALAVYLGSMTNGVSMYWSTPVLPKFHNNETGIDITEGELSWMAAMISPGVMAGSFMSSFIADRFGRRITILTSAAPTIIGTVFLLCANKPWMLNVTRFLWGCGIGIYVTVAGIYLSEIADKEIRGTISVANRFMFNFGSFLVMVIGPFVSYQSLNYMLLILPVVFVAACWWVPETPYCLLKEGKVEKARKVLSKLRGFKDKVLEDQLNLLQSNVKTEMQQSGTLWELFTAKQYRRAVIIAFGLKIVQMMSGSVPILQYLGRIMQDSKTDIAVSTALIIFGGVRFIVGILSSTLVEKLGRRPLLVYSFLGSGICLTIVGIYFYFQEVVGIENKWTTIFRYIPFIGIVISNIISTIGFDVIVPVITAEIFPINVKSLAMTTVYMFAGCCAFSVVKSYQMIKDISGLYGVFLFFGISALVGSLFSYLTVIETKGKSLREIQLEFQGISREESLAKLGEGDNLLDKNKIIELKDMTVLKVNDDDVTDSNGKTGNGITNINS